MSLGGGITNKLNVTQAAPKHTFKVTQVIYIPDMQSPVPQPLSFSTRISTIDGYEVIEVVCGSIQLFQNKMFNFPVYYESNVPSGVVGSISHSGTFGDGADSQPYFIDTQAGANNVVAVFSGQVRPRSADNNLMRKMLFPAFYGGDPELVINVSMIVSA